MLGRALAGAAFVLALSGCATLTQPGPGGTLIGKLIVQWAGENQFIYLPDPDDPLTFVTSDQRRIVPQRMYTDGGSVPPVFWALPGFSPWATVPPTSFTTGSLSSITATIAAGHRSRLRTRPGSWVR